jgi:chromosome segregation ATPase
VTEAEGKVGAIAHAAGTAELNRTGLEAKVTAATSTAATAIASADNLVKRLDTTRDNVEKGLADSDEKRAKLNVVLSTWETSHTEWTAKLEATKTSVTEASAAAIKQIQALTKDPEATLDRRRAHADSVVDDIGRHEAAAADLLQGMKDRDDALRTREKETRATLDEVNETLSSLREKLSFVSALTEKIEGRRSNAEAELDALLAERPPLTIASLWQAAQSSLAVTVTLIVSSVAALLALLALWRSGRHGNGKDKAPSAAT